MLEQLAALCGVLSFLYAVYSAVSGWFRRKTKLRFSNAEIYAMSGDLPGVFYIVKATIKNPASRPVCISSISMRIGGRLSLCAMQDSRVIIGVTNLQTHVRKELCNHAIPFNLDPVSAQRIVLLFHCRSDQLPKSLRPKQLRNHSARVANRTVRLWLQADCVDRRCKSICRARIGDPKADKQDLQRRARSVE